MPNKIDELKLKSHFKSYDIFSLVSFLNLKLTSEAQFTKSVAILTVADNWTVISLFASSTKNQNN